METIAIPGKISNLGKNLPKKRVTRANSCSRIERKESDDNFDDLEKYRQNLNRMIKERK